MPPPSRSNFFHFHVVLGQEFAKIIPPCELAPHPPSGKSWICQWEGCQPLTCRPYVFHNEQVWTSPRGVPVQRGSSWTSLNIFGWSCTEGWQDPVQRELELGSVRDLLFTIETGHIAEFWSQALLQLEAPVTLSRPYCIRHLHTFTSRDIKKIAQL